MNWTPDTNILQEFLNILVLSQSPDDSKQLEVLNWINQFSQTQDYLNYCALLFVSGEVELNCRAKSGILLKNSVVSNFQSLNDQSKMFIKSSVLPLIFDANELIRKTATSISSSIVCNTNLDSWGELYSGIINGINSEDVNILRGIYCLLNNILEDNISTIDSAGDNSLIDKLVPYFLRHLWHQNDDILKLSLLCLEILIFNGNHVLESNLGDYIQCLNNIINHKNSTILAIVVNSLNQICTLYADQIMDYIPSLFEFMLNMISHSDEIVSIRAIEFWSTFVAIVETLREDTTSDTRNLDRLFVQILPNLSLQLLDCLKITSDMELFHSFNDDCTIPDKPENIRPKFIKDRVTGEQESTDSTWNKRTASAIAFEQIAILYEDVLVPILIPLLDKLFNSNDIFEKESGLICLGTISLGKLIHQYIPQLFPFLLQQIQPQSHVLIKSIAHWTISRYCYFVKESPGDTFLPQLVSQLCFNCNDNIKMTQESALASLATLLEQIDNKIYPFTLDIITCFNTVIHKYQVKSLYCLFDCISTFVQHYTYEIMMNYNSDKFNLFNMLCMPILQIWEKHLNDKIYILYIMDCLTDLIPVFGVAFQPFFSAMYDRAFNLIQLYFVNNTSVNNYKDEDSEFNDDHLIVSLLLIGALANVTRESLIPLLEAANFLKIIDLCLQHPRPKPQHTILGIIGDLSHNCSSYLLPIYDNLINILVERYLKMDFINPKFVDCCNNSVWALGEITLVYPQIDKYIKTILIKILDLIQCEFHKATIDENIVITLGRIAMVHSQYITDDIFELFLDFYCEKLSIFEDSIEKDHGCRGLCIMGAEHLEIMLGNLTIICIALFSWHNPPAPDLCNMMRTLILKCQQAAGNRWRPLFLEIPAEIRQIMKDQFKL